MPAVPLGPARLDGFFALATHAPTAAPAAPWEPMLPLLTRPAYLLARVEAVRAALASAAGAPTETVELRVAASVAQLGLTARLLSPVVAGAVLDGVLLDVDLAGLWWQPVLGGAFPLSVPRPPPGVRHLHPDLGREVAATVLDGPVAQLVASVRELSVSTRVLWGNVASAVVGAGSMLAAVRPDAEKAARAFVEDLLARPPLAATMSRSPDGGLRRRSCCLIYRAGGGRARGLCGDCVLA